MAQATTQFEAKAATGQGVRIAVAAWVLTAVYYFYQYALRSAPAVMMPELSNAFGITPIAVAALVGLFYYGYSPFSLVAGAAMDRVGPRRLLPGAAALVGVGALLFATGDTQLASIGRFLQGAGGVFALVGAIYIATKNFSPAKAAPLIGSGVAWSNFWIAMGVIGLAIGIALFFLIPNESTTQSGGGLRAVAGGFAVVFKNPQSILCGLISGLMFIPTTIFDMIWGVRFF